MDPSESATEMHARTRRFLRELPREPGGPGLRDGNAIFVYVEAHAKRARRERALYLGSLISTALLAVMRQLRRLAAAGVASSRAVE